MSYSVRHLRDCARITESMQAYTASGIYSFDLCTQLDDLTGTRLPIVAHVAM